MTWLNRCTRWTALVALVLATLAPSVAHALRHVRGESLPWSLICSATGSMRVIVALDGEGVPNDPGAHAFERCAYCALHHDGAAPPAAAVPIIVELAPAHPSAACSLHAPRPMWAWSAALPRAPPIES